MKELVQYVSRTWFVWFIILAIFGLAIAMMIN